ncbi:MAG: diphosphate--fructose-6-phosphate 1-phosphotransferase [Coprobacillaceae bacterium]
MKNAIIGQSGGPTSVINSSLLGIIEGLKQREDINVVYGMQYGIEGFLEGKIVDLYMYSKDNSFLNNLAGSFLGTCRYKLVENEEIITKIFNILDSYNIGYFYYIGGNDSMDTIKVLHNYASANNIDIQFIGIPKTIDNDLVGTYTSPGYASSAKFIITALIGQIYDVYSYNTSSITIVETMGRDTGWLAAAGCYINGVVENCIDYILVPEMLFDEETFFLHLQNKIKIKKHIFIIVAEGLKNKEGEYLSTPNQPKDAFGNVSRAGIGQYLKNRIVKRFSIKVNVNELGLLQRSNIQVHSIFDKEKAYNQGFYATTLNKSGVMVSLQRSDTIFSISEVDIHDCANRMQALDIKYIDRNNFTIHDTFIEYLKPLIDINTSTLKYFFKTRRNK